MSVGTLAADVGLLLCRTAAVRPRDVLFLLGLGLDLGLFFPLSAFCSTPESDAIQDYGIYVVASEETPSNSPVRGRTLLRKGR